MTIVSPKNIDQLSNETIKQLFDIDKKNLHCTLDEHIETIRSFVKKTSSTNQTNSYSI